MIVFHVGRGPKLFLDRQSVMDIRSCLVDNLDLSPGLAVPDDGDPRIARALQGFLFTCGPEHIRHPDVMDGADGGRTYPLHGSMAGHAARVILNDRTDRQADVIAEIIITMATGQTATLKRHWHMDGESGVVSLHDQLCNTGETAFPPMLMYHMNLGAKHLDDTVALSGAMLEGDGFGWRFGAEGRAVLCCPARPGERDGRAQLLLGPIAAIGGKTLVVGFQTDNLPFLQMWRNQVAPADVLGIEPASHDWKPRAELAASGALAMLQPGQRRDYHLSFAFEQVVDGWIPDHLYQPA
jgi:Domain of unknown function (DUF4432)